MNLDGISQIMQRIHSIETRFGIAAAPAADFNKVLKSEMNAVPPAGVPTAPTGLPAARSAAAAGEIDNLIRSAAVKYGVDPKLVSAVAEAESSRRPDAVSSAGAVGVMQLMPETAKALGVNNVYDPAQNIDGGAKYLKEMLDDFGGDVRSAVAAYNAGPQGVKAYGGVPPYAETQNYVNKVLDLYQ